jgi:hypothetical protein
MPRAAARLQPSPCAAGVHRGHKRLAGVLPAHRLFSNPGELQLRRCDPLSALCALLTAFAEYLATSP